MTIEITRRDGTKFTVPSSKAKNKTGKPKRAPRRKGQTPLYKAVQNVLARNTETKYVATTLKANEPLGWTLDASSTYQTLYSLMPPVARGTSAHTRVGDMIEPKKLRVHLEYTWDKDFQWQYEPYVRQFVCTNKTIKSEDQWAPNYPAIATTEQAKMLDNGDGTHTYPAGSVVIDTTNLRKPGNKIAWTFHKGTKHFYMTKNQGSNNSTIVVLGAPVQPHALGRSTQNFAFDVKCPKKLKYETDASTKPTGFLPLFGAIVGLEGNQDIAGSQPAGIGPYNAGRPTISMINLTVRVEMWYKDI